MWYGIDPKLQRKLYIQLNAEEIMSQLSRTLDQIDLNCIAADIRGLVYSLKDPVKYNQEHYTQQCLKAAEFLALNLEDIINE